MAKAASLTVAKRTLNGHYVTNERKPFSSIIRCDVHGPHVARGRGSRLPADQTIIMTAPAATLVCPRWAKVSCSLSAVDCSVRITRQTTSLRLFYSTLHFLLFTRILTRATTRGPLGTPHPMTLTFYQAPRSFHLKWSRQRFGFYGRLGADAVPVVVLARPSFCNSTALL